MRNIACFFAALTPSQPIVLVVHDNHPSDHALNTLLTGAGFEVFLTSCDEESLAEISRCPAALVLVDVAMPSARGFETFKRLRRMPSLREAPILSVTAATDTAARLAGLAAGAVDYIAKPFAAGEVLARLGMHLELRQLRREAGSKGRLHRRLEVQLEQVLAQAVLVVDAAGHAVFCSRSAQELLARYIEDFDLAETSLLGLLRHGKLSEEPGHAALRACRFSEGAEAPGDDGLTMLLLEEQAPEPSMVLLRALKLTPSEANVLYWVREGKTSPEIAVIVGAALRTVKKHLEHVYEKLGVETRTAAALLASEVLQRHGAA